VQGAGYLAAFTTNTRIEGNYFPQKHDFYGIKRLTMSARDSFLQFFIKVAGLGTCFARKIKTDQD
jgi:hypothetical protein